MQACGRATGTEERERERKRERENASSSIQPALSSACLAQVEIKGVDGELRKLAEDAITIRPNFAYTAKEVRSWSCCT